MIELLQLHYLENTRLNFSIMFHTHQWKSVPLCLFCSARGLEHIAENILSFLDARSLCSAELVCREWHRVISEGMLWKKLIERMVRTDPLWKGLSERHQW